MTIRGSTRGATILSTTALLVGPGGILVHRCVYPSGLNNGHVDTDGSWEGTSKDRKPPYTWTYYYYDPKTGKLRIKVYDKDGKTISTSIYIVPLTISTQFPKVGSCDGYYYYAHTT